jgi:DNA-binding CsgD family transcriptional regulator
MNAALVDPPAELPAGDSEPAGTAPDVLVERDEDVHRLHRMLEDLQSRGTPAVATVLGECGIGRTAVLDRTIALAGQLGIPAMVARCSSQEVGLRYEVAHQLLSSMDIRAPLLGSIRRSSAEFGESALAADLCSRVLRQAWETLLLIVIDDLHFADPESFRWIQALMRRLPGAPILLVIAVSVGMFKHACWYDPWQGVHDGRSFTADEIIRLKPLSRSGIVSVLEASCGQPVDEEFVDAAVRVTEGNPARLQAVARYFAHHRLAATKAHIAELEVQAAEFLRGRVAGSLPGLPTELVRMYQAVAVADGRLPAELVVSLAAVPSSARILRSARESGLVTGEEWPRLADRRIAEPILASLSAAERQEMYARAAELGYRTAISHEALADLLAEARRIDAPWVVPVLRSVAVETTKDAEKSVRLLRRALLEPLSDLERAQVLVELGSVEVPSDPGTSDVHLAQAAIGPGDESVLPSRLRALDLLLARGAAVFAQGLIDRVWDQVGQQDSPALALYWQAAYEEPQPARPVMRMAPGAPLPESPTDPAQIAVKSWQLAAEGRDQQRARQLARAALSSDQRQLMMPRIAASNTLMYTEDTLEALESLDSVLVDARRLQAWAVVGRAMIARGYLHLWSGRVEDAAWDLSGLVEEGATLGLHPLVVANVEGLKACLHVQRGELDEATRIVNELSLPTAPDSSGSPILLFARGYLRYITGDPRAAVQDLEECGRRMLSRQLINPAIMPWRTYAVLARHACGDKQGARQLADDHRRMAAEWGTNSAVGDALFASGMVAEGERKVRLLTDAVRVLGCAPTRLWQARALAELAAARAPFLGPPSSIPLLRRATKFARANGVRALTKRVTEIASSLGLDSHSEIDSFASQLTDADEHLIELAGRGLSNREIAADLGVTQRTVERRLTAVYRKLGVSGRTALRSDSGPCREGTESRAT